MRAAPRVSVIVTCHDLGAYVDEAIESVLAQTFQDFEIILVDDGSADSATCALLEGYQRPKTEVVRTAHQGLAAARNLGVRRACGEYLCALDADDRLAPAYLEKTVRALDADPSIAFASTWLRTFGQEEWEWTPARCDLPVLLWENTVLTAALVRRSAVVDAGGYDTAMPVQGDEDWDLWLTLVEQGSRGTIVPEVLFEYRRRPNSMSENCWHGPGHVPLARYRVRKHARSYRTHAVDVLLHQDDETAAWLRRNDALERRLASELEPALAARQEELHRLRARLERARTSKDAATAGQARAARVLELERALEATAAEVRALRASKSWRVTAPLRTAYDWWRRWLGPA